MPNKEALKADYKQNWHHMRRMGVFQIKNQVNGKVFLASSLNLDGALSRDRQWLTLGGHFNRALQQDWNSFGADAFTIDVLEVLTPTEDARDYADELKLLFEAWMAQLEPYGDRGYFPVPRRR